MTAGDGVRFSNLTLPVALVFGTWDNDCTDIVRMPLTVIVPA